MKVLVSDMGGVLYSFDPEFDPMGHEAAFHRMLTEGGNEKSEVKKQLEEEYRAVANGSLRIYPHRQAVANVLKNCDNYRLVIVSTSLPQTSALILSQIGLKGIAWKIYNMAEFGSKKDAEAWKNIFVELPSLDAIVEDSDINLAAARRAAESLGYQPRLSVSMPLL